MTAVEDGADVPESSSPVVRYSVKELFAIINGKLDTVVTALDGKASQVDLDALSARVDRNTEQIDKLLAGLTDRASSNASRIQKLEDDKLSRADVWRTMATTAGILIGTLTALAAVITLIVHLAMGG